MGKFKIRIFGVLFIIGICMLAILLFWNIKLKHELTRKQNQCTKLKNLKSNYETYIDNKFLSEYYVGLKFPIVPVVDTDKAEISTDFSYNKVSVVLMFRPNTCQPCLTTLLNLIKYLNKNISDKKKIPVFIISDIGDLQLTSYRKVYDFECHFINDAQNKFFSAPFDKVTPIVFLVDNNNTILSCHIPIIGKNYISLIYFKTIERFFDLNSPIFEFKLAKMSELLNDKSSYSNFDYLFY